MGEFKITSNIFYDSFIMVFEKNTEYYLIMDIELLNFNTGKK